MCPHTTLHTQVVKFLSTVPVAADSPLYQKLPAVAVVGGDNSGDFKAVRIFSLADNSYVHRLGFHGDVHAVVCNRHCLIVCLKNQLIIHKMHDMTCTQVRVAASYGMRSSLFRYEYQPRKVCVAAS
jgi:hypothetical protein